MKSNETRVVDEFLVMRCQDGDPKALSALVTKWQPPFLRYARLLAGDPDMAADIVQDAWIKIIRALPKLRDPLRFDRWAYRIINHQCMDALRKLKPRSEQHTESGFMPMAALEDKEQVWSILAELSTQHRSVLALHYLQGFDVVDIARIIRIPEGTVKSRLHHAREKFRKLLDSQETPSTSTHQENSHDNYQDNYQDNHQDNHQDNKRDKKGGHHEPNDRQAGQSDHRRTGIRYRPA